MLFRQSMAAPRATAAASPAKRRRWPSATISATQSRSTSTWAKSSEERPLPGTERNVLARRHRLPILWVRLRPKRRPQSLRLARRGSDRRCCGRKSRMRSITQSNCSRRRTVQSTIHSTVKCQKQSRWRLVENMFLVSTFSIIILFLIGFLQRLQKGEKHCSMNPLDVTFNKNKMIKASCR